MTPALTALLAALQRTLAEVPSREAPAVLSELRRIEGQLEERMLGSLLEQLHGQPEAASAEEDRLLTPEEAAARLSVTVEWLYRHHRRLPFSRPQSRRCLRFSEAGLRKWLAAKRA